MTEHLHFPSSWSHPVMPGYGTFPAPFATSAFGYSETARNAQAHLQQALSLGYRHFDTAFTYRNQDLVGAAVRAVGIDRTEVFLTSKLHPNDNTYANALARIQEAIGAIWDAQSAQQGGYLDGFLLHYPGCKDPLGAWKGLREARERGWVRHIGVSNFETRHLEKLFLRFGQYPELDQIEFHPCLYAQQKDLLEFCRGKDIAVEGYCPLAEGAVLEQLEVQAIAAAHGTTPARVALKWSMQHGVRPIVGSRNSAHLSSNGAPYDFTLSQEEMTSLNNLSIRNPIRVSLKWQWNPSTAPLGSSRLRSLTDRVVQRVAQAVGPK